MLEPMTQPRRRPRKLTAKEVQAMSWEQRDRLKASEVPPEIQENAELRHELFRHPRGVYDAEGAAKYLGMTKSGLNYYDYRQAERRGGQVLKPFLIGRSRTYTQEVLDEFEKTRRAPGFLPKWDESAD